VLFGLTGASVRTVNVPAAGVARFHPISASGNSNDRFFTRSGYSPPSAAKLMSSKNTPTIVLAIGAPGVVPSASVIGAVAGR
jgi:hypothetical protein